MANNLVELFIKSNSKGAINDIKKVKEETRSTRTELSLMFSILGKLTKKIDKIADYTGEYTTAMRTLKATLGETSREATTFIKRLSEMSGLDETTLTKQTNKFVQLGQSLSYSNELSEKFAENLSILSTKLSLLYDMDYTTMASSIQKAIQGTQTTLKAQTGIALNEFSEQATLNAYGIDRQVSSLNESELALVKYATILRQVTSDTNVYQNAVNSLGWQKATLTAQVKKLATTVGQVLSPVMTHLYTVMKAVVMVVTEFVKMIGALIGVNVDVSASVGEMSGGYGDLASNIDKASSSAKKSLRSFDKLNNITTPTAGGKSAGGGLGIDSSMLSLLGDVDENFLKIKDKATEIRDRIMEWLGFTKLIDEEGNIIGWRYEGFGKTIKNIWNWFKNLNAVSKVFVGLGIYAVISKIISGFKKLWNTIQNTKLVTWLTNLQSKFTQTFTVTKNGVTSMTSMATALDRVKIGIVGIIGVIAGLSLLTEGIKDMTKNGITFVNVLETIAGAILTIVGVVGVLESVVGFFNPWMAVIGGVVAGIVGIVTALSGQDEAVQNSTEYLTEYQKKLKEVKESQQEDIRTLESKTARVKTLQKQLLNLVDSNGKVIGSQEEASKIVSALNELLGIEYKITGDQITLNGEKIRSYDGLKESIDKYCNSLRAEALLEIKREEYNTRLKRQLELQEEIDRITNILRNSQKNYDMTTQEGMKKWFEDSAIRISQLGNLQGQYKTNAQYLDAYEQAGYNASIGRYDESQELLTKTFDDVSVNLRDMVEELGVDADKMADALKSSIHDVTDQDYSTTIKVNADTQNAQRQLRTFFDGVKQQSFGFGLSGGFRADGGFVNEGELFIARESGPELVGSMNGHTAVANNDQIVQGIQAGVFNGMMNALRNTDFGGNVVIEANGDTDGLLNFITFKQKQRDRQFN